MASKRNQIDRLIEVIGEITNTPTTELQAINKGVDTYLTYEYNISYGGYRVIGLNLFTGSHSTILGFTDSAERLPRTAFMVKLQGFIQGVDYMKSLKQ